MIRYLKAGIVVVVVGIVGLMVAVKRQGQATDNGSGGPYVEPAARSAEAMLPLAGAATRPAARSAEAGSVPRLVDLGAHACLPCKMMAPILDELRREYAGRLEVEFIDVWQNPDAGRKYGIRVIPTQIFFDAAGRELARHEGFMSKEEILAKWSSLGISLSPAPAKQE